MTDRSLVVISAGLKQPSSTRLLADQLANSAVEAAKGRAWNIDVTHVELRDSAHHVVDSMLMGYASPPLEATIDTIAKASGLILATPVFTASVSGLFKSFFDILPKDLLVGMPVLMAASGGTPRHALVLEQAMRPILTFLRAIVVPTSVFAAPEDWGGASAGGMLSQRIDRAAYELAIEMERSPPREAIDMARPPASFEALLAASSA